MMIIWFISVYIIINWSCTNQIINHHIITFFVSLHLGRSAPKAYASGCRQDQTSGSKTRHAKGAWKWPKAYLLIELKWLFGIKTTVSILWMLDISKAEQTEARPPLLQLVLGCFGYICRNHCLSHWNIRNFLDQFPWNKPSESSYSRWLDIGIPWMLSLEIEAFPRYLGAKIMAFESENG